MTDIVTNFHGDSHDRQVTLRGLRLVREVAAHRPDLPSPGRHLAAWRAGRAEVWVLADVEAL